MGSLSLWNSTDDDPKKFNIAVSFSADWSTFSTRYYKSNEATCNCVSTKERFYFSILTIAYSCQLNFRDNVVT